MLSVVGVIIRGTTFVKLNTAVWHECVVVIASNFHLSLIFSERLGVKFGVTLFVEIRERG